jgi:KDO2-lipid IV(A) lauroyltransferase
VKKPPIFRSALVSFVASMPQRHMARAGKLLGTLAYIVDRRHQRIVKRNLKFIYPEWSWDRIQKVSKRVFQNMAITLLEICQMTCLSREDILRKVRIRGKDNLLNGMKNPKGLILISAHLGNWEMAHVFASCYVRTPLVLVARKIRPKVLNQWVHQVRTRFGSVVLDKAGALPKMARILHHGGPVGVLIDQGTLRSEGIEVAFFGKTVTATPAAAILARRYNSPVVPAFCIREGDGSLTLLVEPPLDLKRTKDMPGDLQVNTQMMNDAIEQAVKAYPEQWFWFHKRWKRHYPHLYREDLARRKQQKARKKAISQTLSQ